MIKLKNRGKGSSKAMIEMYLEMEQSYMIIDLNENPSFFPGLLKIVVITYA